MQIANPIYDVVFKYLLEDKKVAKLFLSAILEKEIIDLEFKPQEYTTDIKEKSLTVYRIDFKAKIKLNENETKIVLIELQKAKLMTDIMRFRRYLGKQYANEDNTIKKDNKIEALPIITIYFIAYTLKELKDIPIIYVKRSYIDRSTNKIIDKTSEFIESLTHDSIIIQIEAIKNKKRKNQLEKLLSIFETKKVHKLSIDENDYPDKYRPIIRRLIRALADEELEFKMEIEDDILEELQLRERQNEELIKRVKEEEQRRKEADERAKKIEEEKIRAEKRALEAEKIKAIEIAKNLLNVLDDEAISQTTGLSVDEIKKLRDR